MMKVIRSLLLCAIVGSTLLLPRSAIATVLLKPNGKNATPLRTKSLAANIHIEGQFATTDLVLTFQNETAEQIEADFLYTVPPGAVVTYFAYWYGEEKCIARVVEKERAKAIYEHITTRMRDPALIEMVGKNTFRARIFPVMPNADLKVEIKMAQVLPSDRQGAVYELPLRADEEAQSLDSLTLNVLVKPGAAGEQVVSNYPMPIKQSAEGYRLTLARRNYRPSQDWRVRLMRPAAPLHAALYAAPAAGEDGFFALALTPDRALINPAVSVRGVTAYEVLPAVLPGMKAHQALTLYGRYKGSGPATVTLTGTASSGWFKHSRNFVFGKQRVSHNLATRLWAAQRIEQLSARAKNREAVIKLSKQFTLPSKFTSWLAVPKAEIERYREEMRRADLELAGRQLLWLMDTGQHRSRQARQLRTRFEQLCRKLQTNPQDELEQIRQQRFSTEMEDISQRLAEQIARGRGRRRTARRLRARFERLCRRLGTESKYELSEMLSVPLDEVTSRLVAERFSARPNRVRMASLQRQVRRLARAINTSAQEQIRYKEQQWTQTKMSTLAQELANEKFSKQPDAARMALLRRELKRVETLTRSPAANYVKSAESSLAQNKMYGLAANLVGERNSERPDAERLAALQAEVQRLERMTGVAIKDYLSQAESAWTWQEIERLQARLHAEYSGETPDEQAIERMKARYTALNTKVQGAEQAKQMTAQLTIELDLARVNRDLNAARAQGRTVEVQDLTQRRTELSRQQQKLFARAGDPLISIEAPGDATHVIALLPGGEVKRLAFNVDSKKWEARFDIPTYAVEGDYTILVIIVRRDGTRQTVTMHYRVDMTPPTGSGRAETLVARTNQAVPTLRLELDGSADTRRVFALLPWGEKIELRPSALQKQRFFALAAVPSTHRDQAAVVTFILTDKAHNRTSITVDMSK
ncbi:MAG TPA: VIT domain-containing protein [Abditibacteriaceae bacterium]|nr:VIT domain-containing protein [Abditibacteriaceae bacterium]